MFRKRSQIVVRAWTFGIVVLLASAGLSAQQPARAPETDTIRGRQKISLIEGMFERAVQNGVENFSRRIQAVMPNADGMAMLMGAPQVRGFRLLPPGPGGVFFDVLMPSLQLSMVWPLRYAQNADAQTLALLAEFRSDLERVTDQQQRFELTQKLRQLEQQLTPPGAAPRRGPATTVANVQAGAAPRPSVSPADVAIIDDPAEAWRQEVRSTLIDVMIENTGLTIAPDEFIIVAARGVLSADRLVSDSGDARTIELRLKGSDLAAYRAGSITLEEARKRVGVREY
jgi:hypothetical protein